MVCYCVKNVNTNEYFSFKKLTKLVPVIEGNERGRQG